MSRSRASAVLSALVATLAMTLGVLPFTTGAASAAPGDSTTATKNYPPAPPALVVNKGVVKIGVKVKATGRFFQAKEKVTVTVFFRAKGSSKTRIVRTATVTADKKGKFTVNVKVAAAGMVFIQGTGKSSGRTAAAYVFVIDKKKGGGGFVIKPAAFSTGLTGGDTGTSVLTPAGQNSTDGAGLAVAALGLIGAAGSLLVTRQVVRRRRKVAVTA